MPGELGDEDSFTSQQQPGYYEHRYQPKQEFMDDERKVQKEDDSSKLETQKERLMRKWRKQFIHQPKPESSMLPTGGPEQGTM